MKRLKKQQKVQSDIQKESYLDGGSLFAYYSVKNLCYNVVGGDSMTEELARQVLEQLKSGEISEYRVEKEQFLAFQPELHKHPEFKNFRGAAKHGGVIVYTYQPGWTA